MRTTCSTSVYSLVYSVCVGRRPPKLSDASAVSSTWNWLSGIRGEGRTNEGQRKREKERERVGKRDRKERGAGLYVSNEAFNPTWSSTLFFISLSVDRITTPHVGHSRVYVGRRLPPRFATFCSILEKVLDFHFLSVWFLEEKWISDN